MKIPVSLPDSGSRPFDVVGFGENSLDLVVDVADYPGANTKVAARRMEELPGGQVATAMTACARLGLRTRYVGRFGGDRAGEIGVESLRREGVDTAFAERVAGAASRSAVLIVDAARGTRTVLWHRDPALVCDSDVPARAIADGRVLLVDATDLPAATRVASIAREARMAAIVDVDQVSPGIEALLNAVDVIVAAERFPRELTGETETGAALDALARRFHRSAVVCVTLGEEGSLARCGGREIRTPAFPIDCVDPTGAGDVFRAGFIAGWLRHGEQAELEDVLRYANAAASLNCRAIGARTAAPAAHEVEALLRN